MSPRQLSAATERNEMRIRKGKGGRAVAVSDRLHLEGITHAHLLLGQLGEFFSQLGNYLCGLSPSEFIFVVLHEEMERLAWLPDSAVIFDRSRLRWVKVTTASGLFA